MCLCCRPPPAPALRAQEDQAGCTKQSTIQMRCLKQLAVSSVFLKHLPVAFFTARRTVKGLSSPNKCCHTKIKISLTASIHAPEWTLRLVLSPIILAVPGNSYYSWTILSALFSQHWLMVTWYFNVSTGTKQNHMTRPCCFKSISKLLDQVSMLAEIWPRNWPEICSKKELWDLIEKTWPPAPLHEHICQHSIIGGGRD